MAQAASPLRISLTPSNIAPLSAAAPDAAETRTSAAYQRVCAHCENRNPAAKLCLGCHAVRFCNATCQRAGWAAHKAICQNPTLQDENGLTPLHRTTLAGKKIEPEFLEKHKTVRDSFNGTIEDLNSMMAPLPPDDETLTGWEFEDVDGRIKPLTRKKYHEITGNHYLDGFHGSAEDILHFHNQPPKRYEILPDPNAQSFDPKKAPKTYLKYHPKMGWGVFSKQDIKENTIVCLGAGKLTKEEVNNEKSMRYDVIGDINSTEISGKGTLLNDGPPNCRILLIKNYKGVRFAPVIVAIRDIKPGEELRVDYTATDEIRIGMEQLKRTHAVKIGSYAIAPEALRELETFCTNDYYDVSYEEARRLTKFGVEKLFEIHGERAEVAQQNPVWNFVLQLSKAQARPITAHQKAQLYYFFNTPYAFIRMHLLKIAAVEKTRPIVRSFNSQIRVFKGFDHSKMLDAIDKIHEIEKQGDKTIVNEVLKMLDEEFSSISFSEILKVMNKDEHLSHNRIKHYRTMQIMIDETANFSNAFVRGLKILRSGDEKEVELDNQSLIKRFHTIPTFFRKEYLRQLDCFIQTASKDGRLKEIQILVELQSALQAIK